MHDNANIVSLNGPVWAHPAEQRWKGWSWRALALLHSLALNSTGFAGDGTPDECRTWWQWARREKLKCAAKLHPQLPALVSLLHLIGASLARWALCIRSKRQRWAEHLTCSICGLWCASWTEGKILVRENDGLMEQDSTEIGMGSWNGPLTEGLQVAKTLDDVLQADFWCC